MIWHRGIPNWTLYRRPSPGTAMSWSSPHPNSTLSVDSYETSMHMSFRGRGRGQISFLNLTKACRTGCPWVAHLKCYFHDRLRRCYVYDLEEILNWTLQFHFHWDIFRKRKTFQNLSGCFHILHVPLLIILGTFRNEVTETSASLSQLSFMTRILAKFIVRNCTFRLLQLIKTAT